MYIYSLSYLFSKLSFLKKPNFFEENDEIILEEVIKEEIKRLLQTNIEDEYVKIMNKLNEQEYKTCEDYLFLHGFNNLFSTIIFFLKFKNNPTLNFIKEYFEDIEESSLIIFNKLSKVKHLSIDNIFINHQTLFINIARLDKKNVKYSRKKLKIYSNDEINKVLNKIYFFNFINHKNENEKKLSEFIKS